MVEWQVYNADCLDVLSHLDLVDAVVTDPPYGLSFMGKNWDHGVPGVVFWKAILDAMKPGAHLLAFGGTRTHHRLMVAIEDAGFEIRDVIMWVYGSGFPKSLNVSKAIDRAAKVERKVVDTYTARGFSEVSPTEDGRNQWAAGEVVDKVGYRTEAATDDAKKWEGWGTALKPAYEPIILARKPLIGTVAQNVLEYGTGALNIDESRVEMSLDDHNIVDSRSGWSDNPREVIYHKKLGIRKEGKGTKFSSNVQGRWPANLIHDGSEEVLELFPDRKGASSNSSTKVGHEGTGWGMGDLPKQDGYNDEGSAARFFYCAKANRKERDAGLTEEYTAGEMTDRKDGSAGLDSPRAGAGRTSGGKNNHPTVKPLALMRYLCKLITPPNGVILDPFAGSGSTLIAANQEGFDSIGIELEKEYAQLMVERLEGCESLLESTEKS